MDGISWARYTFRYKIVNDAGLRGCYHALVFAILRQAISDALAGDRLAEMALRHPFWSSVLDTLHADGAKKLIEMLATEKGRAHLRKRLEGIRI